MILLTGATGTVGRELAAQLLEGNEKIRVLVRDPAKAEHLKGRAEIVQGDLEQADTLAAAMKGADHVFLLTVDQATATDANVIAAAKAAGVAHVVKLSTSFVANDPQTAIGAWHAEKEQLLKDSGLAWTMLRPGGFMSNSLQWVGSIKSQGTVYSAMGSAKSAPIDPADIAAVAKAALTKPGHEGKAYELSGGELLTQAEQVEILSKAIGKPLKTVEVTVAAAVEGMRASRRMPPKLVDAMGEMLETIRAGKLFRPATDTVEKITGRKPATYESWCLAHRAAFL
ncbi:MAG TPA: NAD(P)H-binding protein [bacterium]|jgi:uncharacterized protein YbjT (DUF2867 family)|nr:NAD(P)H-binding protein [bacterium]